MDPKDYIRENWGAPFVIGFILLLIASAVELGIGRTGAADSVAVYAFYSLVIGVALQIASYVKYGDRNEEHLQPSVGPQPAKAEKPRRLLPDWSNNTKILAAAIIALVVLTSVTAALYFAGVGLGFVRIAPMSAQVTSATFVQTPNGNTTVAVALAAYGGEQPYTYKVSWANQASQSQVSNTTAVFLWHLGPGVQVPTSATVTVTSTDGQILTLTAQFVNATS